ncbi:MAG: 16S rRNA (uracil(1498)-N(3))-methyltransferase [Actinobacteria bacterium]|nr:16S rRNA (uracil(1498)-N(3))-methyltransferase [Actinomycetota bacterium]
MVHHRLPELAAHVFVDDLDGPELCPDDAHHLTRVLRLRDGEQFSAGDGAGRWRLCAMRGDAAVDALGPIETLAPASPWISVAFALTKGDKPEFTVQKLTELGVDRIVPVSAARSVVRWDEAKSARNVQRWRAVARAAAMQSRRAWLPIVDDVTSLIELTPAFALAHPDGGVLSLATPAVAIGPEGGWADGELASAVALVDLGPTTLRAETAALAVGARLTALRTGGI